MNKFIGIGRITKAAETRTVNVKGVKTLVTDFTVALDNGRNKPEGDERYGTPIDLEFIRCSVWRDKGARIAKYLTKGRMVMVTGALRGRAWTGDDGNARYELNMSNPQIELIGKNPTTGDVDTLPVADQEPTTDTEPHEYIDAETGEIITTDDLPFGE